MAEKTLRGRQNVIKGRLFEDKVAALYELLGYSVQQNIAICNKKVDILATYQVPGTDTLHRIIVECKNENTSTAQNQIVLEFKGLLDIARSMKLADSAEIITRKPWGDFARGLSKDVGIGLLTFEEKRNKIINFSTYIDRVVHDYEHFNEYRAAGGFPLKTPIIEIMNRSDLYRTFIPLMCRVVNAQKEVQLEALDNYIEEWLADPLHNHLSILGDFGTGKSSFCLQLTYKLAKRYKKDSINARIPLFISLHDYSKAVNLQQLITDLLLNKYNIVINNFAVFQRFLESGNLVLIFDGFDEMATKTDKALTIRNFEELTRVVVAGSKTILTCRTHYFTDQRHVDDILRRGEGNELLQCISHKPNFQIVELEEFSDDQIKQLLKRCSPADWEHAWVTIRRYLYDLARRPLLLDMIIKTLPHILSMKKTVNAIHLYEAYTRLWIEREDWHARMTTEVKSIFMEQLAMKMWKTGNSSISYIDLKLSILDNFKAEIVTQEDLDYFDNDTRTCSFLNRDSNGNYQFIHKSFMEFFVAKSIFEQLKSNRIEPSFREKEITPEIASFIAQFVSENLDALEKLSFWAFDETHMVSWNAINILAYLKYFSPENVVQHLVKLCRQTQLKSGVTWLLGELGVASKDVLELLNNAILDSSRPRTWWEAAFALQKIDATFQPIDRLIENLPATLTYEKALDLIDRTFQAHDEPEAIIDQRTVAAIVKQYRIQTTKEREATEEKIKNIFSKQELSNDVIGRRSYYAVWLIGELKISSALPTLLLMSDHPQLAVRNVLAEALGKIGNRKAKNATDIGQEGLSVLKKLLVDPYFRTRLHAAEAVGRIKVFSLLDSVIDAYEKEPLLDVQNEQLKTIKILKREKAKAQQNGLKCFRAPTS